ncbi:MAG: hypothetical protein GXO60_02730 [Epsilonproteobacteria bacterium]|nr:hypothetical protein [Campylobacterota bacterium]
MAIESYVDDILQNSEHIFRQTISLIVARSDKNAKIEIVRQYTRVDTILLEAIKSILNDLKLEEGILSRFLYRYFKIEIFKNKKREQLLILGSQLKTQYNNLNKEINRVNIHIQNISTSLYKLKLLHSALYQKSKKIVEREKLNKCNSFIKKLNLKIDEMGGYEKSLEQKLNMLTDNLKVYTSVYERIPKYYELQDENNQNLLSHKV